MMCGLPTSRQIWAYSDNGLALLPCKQGVGVRFPVSPPFNRIKPELTGYDRLVEVQHHGGSRNCENISTVNVGFVSDDGSGEV